MPTISQALARLLSFLTARENVKWSGTSGAKPARSKPDRNEGGARATDFLLGLFFPLQGQISQVSNKAKACKW